MKLLLLLLFSYCCRLHAQDSSIHIKAGMSVNEAVSVTDLYQYPQFSLGKVFFKSGDSTMAKLNYHTLLDEMLFINSKGDTLSLPCHRHRSYPYLPAGEFVLRRALSR